MYTKVVQLFLFVLLATTSSFASPDSTSVFSISGNVDTYYVYDFNKNPDYELPFFMFNCKRTNEIAVNTGLLSAKYSTRRTRANAGFMTGTYQQVNNKTDIELLSSVYELNGGVALDDSLQVWFDVGIMPSYIGFETILFQDNWTVTRSLCAEASPYYVEAAKLTYRVSPSVTVAGIVCNGWQRIYRVAGSSGMSFGTQLTMLPSEGVTFNWSTFIGSDDADSLGRTRIFNNLYGMFSVGSKVSFIAGFDIGVQSPLPMQQKNDIWFSPIVVCKIQPYEQLAIALRAEYFHDPKGVVFLTGSANEFSVGSGSVTVEYSPVKNTCFRLEQRLFSSTEPILKNNGTTATLNAILIAAFSVRFP
ncbi:MAG: outer membrane beta-barrel protein [Candidatus Kapaibacterium sp.]